MYLKMSFLVILYIFNVRLVIIRRRCAIEISTIMFV